MNPHVLSVSAATISRKTRLMLPVQHFLFFNSIKKISTLRVLARSIVAGFFLLSAVFATAQTTETFETATGGALSFTSAGTTFNLSTNALSFYVANFPGLGYNQSNKFIQVDDTYEQTAALSVANGTFKISSLWLFVTGNASQTPGVTNGGGPGSVTFRGKLAGVTQFTVVKSSGFVTTYNLPGNGFGLVNFATEGGTNNTNVEIDRLEVQLSANYDYFAIDNLTWSSSIGAPTLTTTAVASIGAATATLGGNVTADGGASVTERGIVWGTTTNPTTANNKVANGNGTGSFSQTVTSLPANTQIYVRAYAINSAGTSYGSNINFKTNAVLSAGTSQTNLACYGGSNGTASVSVNGGKAPYTYLWSPSVSSGASASGLVAGTYSCTITDAESTTITKNFTLTQPAAALSSSVSSQTNVSCNGGTNAKATIAATGGSAPYFYSWSPAGGTAATATGLFAATYTVYIEDVNGCSTTQTVAITQPNPLTTSVSSQTNVSCNGGTNGSATVAATGGTGAYTYTWSPSGGTAATATGLAPGVYTVRVTDANSCFADQKVTITQPTGMSTSVLSQTNIACNSASTGSATIKATGGAGAYTYSWSPSGGTAATATGLAAGVYTVTITDANSCTAQQKVTLTQSTAISTSITSQTNVACNNGSNGSATIKATGGAGAYTYSWSPSGGTAATATGLAAGVYNVTVTDANNCTAIQQVTITQPTAISTSVSSQTNVSCNGGSNGTATVKATGGEGSYTYSWSPGFNYSATATGLSAGTYTVTITDANNCTATQKVTIVEPAFFQTSIASQTNIACNTVNTGAATISATGGTGAYTYSWSPSGGTAATATGLAAGVYNVTVTDANYCMAIQKVTIQPSAGVSTSVTSQTNIACNGGSTGAATIKATGGAGAYTYSWSPSGGTAATATGLSAGTYTVTVTDENSCTATQTVTITQPTALIASVSSQSNVSCNGGSNGFATVKATGGAGSYTYQWSPGYSSSSSASGLAAGAYTVTITDANNCTATTTVTITQPAFLSATISKTDVTCNGGTNGTATINATGGTGSYTYSWSPSGGTAKTATGLTPGTYTCIITDANSCQAMESVTITEPAPIAVTATPSSETICSGSATSIALSSVPSGADFTWTVSAVSGNVSGATSGTGTTIAQTLTGSGVVKYTITPMGSICSGSTKEVLITVNALTTIEMHPSDKSAYDEESVKFAVEANNATTYQWQVDAGNGFTDITDDAHYSGTDYYILKIVNITGAMNGNRYRVVATGKCAPVSSNNAKLTVKVRTAQAISFAAADIKVYGDNDYSPVATSDAGLDLSYSSSDVAVASVENGKIHIKKAGQVTITASQAGDDDYKPATSVQQVLTIDKKSIAASLSATPAISKVYDTYAGIKLAAANYSLNEAEAGDDVTVTGTAAFDDSNAGDDKTIKVIELTLAGESADNYKLTNNSAEVKGAIKPAAITVSLNASPLVSKTYNASDAASLAAANYSLHGVLGEDDVAVASSKALYSDKKAGAEKEITASEFVLSGAQKDNYTVTTASAVTYGDIKVKEIAVTLAATPAISKVYDGNDKATVPAAKYQLSAVETGDEVTVKATAVYNNRQAADNKTVTVNEFTLDGADAANYQLSTTELTTEGAVEKASLTVKIVAAEVAVTKEYDGKTEAILGADNYLLEGVIADDYVKLNNPTKGSYDNKHGGEGKKVTVDELIIIGEDADNYTLASTTVSANIGTITAKVIRVTADAKTKVYGQADPELTYVTEGVLEADVLPGALSRTEGKNAGEYKVEQGTLEGGTDYLIESFQNASFTITPAPLTITAEDKTKKQGTVNPVFTFKYSGLAEGDQPFDLQVQATATSAAASGSPIGYYDIEASGAASTDNYSITYIKGKLTVTPATDATYSVKVWSPNPNQLQIKIYTEKAQKAAIVLYTETGQQVILQQQQLAVGINSVTVSVAHLSSSTYILGVQAEQFKDAQKVKVK